jgi:spore coat polysaccharide biosynthesis protein SpsF
MNRHKLLIRCDAAPEIGFGHVVRCLALADELRNGHRWQVEFAMMKGQMGFAQVQAKGYVVHCAPTEHLSGEQEGAWLQQLVKNILPQALLLDVRTDLTTSAIQSIRASGVLIVTIDDPSERRLAADLAFYPPVPQVEKMDWTGFSGERYVGWKWVLLRPEFARARERKLLELPRSENCPPKVLVTMGGSDPAGFTLTVLKALDTLQEDLSVCVVLGAGFLHDQELSEWLKRAQRTYTIKRNVADMAELMGEADLAIASFGVTAYELATVGVPAVYVCLSEDHAESCEIFVAAEMAVSLGDYRNISTFELSEALGLLVIDPQQRHIMSEIDTQLIDGRGVERVADKIVNLTFSCS